MRRLVITEARVRRIAFEELLEHYLVQRMLWDDEGKQLCSEANMNEGTNVTVTHALERLDALGIKRSADGKTRSGGGDEVEIPFGRPAPKKVSEEAYRIFRSANQKADKRYQELKPGATFKPIVPTGSVQVLRLDDLLIGQHVVFKSKLRDMLLGNDDPEEDERNRPITAVTVGAAPVLVDGHHRATMEYLLGKKTIPVHVYG